MMSPTIQPQSAKAIENIQILFWRAPPPLGRSHSRDLAAALGRQLSAPSDAAFPAESLRALVFARIAHILLDLAGQNLGDANRVRDGVGGSFLALRSLRHSVLKRFLTLSI